MYMKAMAGVMYAIEGTLLTKVLHKVQNSLKLISANTKESRMLNQLSL